MYKNNYTPQSSQLYSRYFTSGLTFRYQYNPSHQQNKEKLYDNINRYRKRV